MKPLLIAMCMYTFALSACAQADLQALASELEKDLKGNVLLLRRFPIESDLKFDADLMPEKDVRWGSWTESAVRVDLIEVKGNSIVMTGQRAAFVREKQNGVLVKTLVPEDKKFDVTRPIKITLKGPFQETPSDFLEKVKRSVFITDFNELQTLAPPWWQPYLKGEAGANASKPGPIPTGEPYARLANGAQVYRVERGVVSAPRPIKSPDPEYTDLARVARFQGVTVLSAIVLPTGETGEIKIVRPLGMGLDDKAVTVVQTWKFNPALKDGVPVAVQVNIEVSFNLY